MTIGGLIVYGFIGFLIGKIAEFTVMESVRTTVQKEIAAQSDSAHHTQHP
jgi:predicted PurR-regulated permease PerM